MNLYKEIEVKLIAENPSLVSDLLWELEPLGIEEISTSVLKCYFPEEFNLSSIENYLKELQSDKMLESFTLTETVLQNKNWNEEWEKTINVIKVSDTFVIKPTFREYTPNPGEIVLTIDPKMSFGTGEHQTTKLMIRAIEKYCKSDYTVLDIGTGTGILAIAAVKMGANKAIAFDNDPWCLENGIENCELNNAAGLVDIRTAELSEIPEIDFDIVIANIQRNPLLALCSEVVGKAKSKGVVLLSGLLVEDESIIIEKYLASGTKHIETVILDEWISVVLIKD